MSEKLTYQPNLSEISQTPEVLKPTPYVVSGDITILLQRWADKKGLTLPSSAFFTDLRGEFDRKMAGIFPGYEFVDETEIVDGLAQQVAARNLPAISMDGVYFPSKLKIDMARHVDEERKPVGLWKRPGAQVLFDQFTLLQDNLASAGATEAAIVDDVLFEGRQVGRVIPLIEKKTGVKVPTVFAAITIGEGKQTLQNLGVDVQSVRSYDEVIDQICERDFYAGVAQSGRTVKNDYGADIGAPYFLPFGDPYEWASIPKEQQKAFSRFCLEQSIRLYEGIEQASGRTITCSDVDRKVIGLPQDDTRFVDALTQTLEAPNML